MGKMIAVIMVSVATVAIGIYAKRRIDALQKKHDDNLGRIRELTEKLDARDK